MIIKFGNISTDLTTRNLGTNLRKEIHAQIAQSQNLIFDFEGVEVVSNSFADECFAKLLLDLDMNTIKQHTTFKNTTPFIAQTISFAFKQRQAVAHA